MAKYVSPTGHEIIGTKERIPAVAIITGIEPDGSPIYAGSTDIDWNGQGAVYDADGNMLFVDADNESWTFDQLTLKEEAYND